MLSQIVDDSFLQKYYMLEIILFAMSYSFCVLPKAIKSVSRLAKVIPILTLTSAGFLLAVLLLDFIPHMFPHEHHDHLHNLPNHNSHDHENDTIVGMFCAGLSLLFLICIDQCIIKHDHCEDSHDEESCVHSEGKLLHKENNGDVLETVEENDAFENKEIQYKALETITIENIESVHKNEDLGCCDTKALKNTNSKTKALIYILSISIHSFFEGLGIKRGAVGTYEIGIILHKTLESFAIGMTLFNSSFSFVVCLFMNFIYSVLTPLGMLISRVSGGNDFNIWGLPVTIICNGLALGSLLFIVFLEMIPGAFHKKGSNVYKMLALFGGFILSSVVIMYTPHSH